MIKNFSRKPKKTQENSRIKPDNKTKMRGFYSILDIVTVLTIYLFYLEKTFFITGLVILHTVSHTYYILNMKDIDAFFATTIGDASPLHLYKMFGTIFDVVTHIGILMLLITSSERNK